MARTCRSAVLSGIPDDLALLTCAVLKTTLHSDRPASDLDRGGPFDLRDDIGNCAILVAPWEPRAYMNEWRRLSILGPTLGILIVSGALLFLTRRSILPTRAALVGLNTAYLANAALCLVVYGPMPGTVPSRCGWIVTMVIVWPMLLELLWIFAPRQKALK